MATLKGSKTEQSLKDAFAGESQANRRYLYFANMCDIAGENDTAALFRSTAEGETGHAHGHMEFLINGGAGEPGTGMPGRTPKKLWKLQSTVKHMSTPICIQAWQRLPVKKALTRLPTGSKHWRRLSAHTLTATPRLSQHWKPNLPSIR